MAKLVAAMPGTLETSTLKVRTLKKDALDRRPMKVGVPQVSAPKVSTFDVTSAKTRSAKAGITKYGVTHPTILKDYTFKHDTCEIYPINQISITKMPVALRITENYVFRSSR